MPRLYDECLDVTDFCVVSETIYGYRPNLGASGFFIAAFAACLAIQFFQGIKWRTWFYMGAMTIGCLGEVIAFGPEHSRLVPKWYTWIFIGCDLFSLILQGVGGGIASSAESESASDAGSNIMLAGIVWQVITLIVFAALAADFTLRVTRARSNLTLAASELLQSTKFRLFGAGLVTAYLTILIRCVYRIAELAGGWKNDIMRNEAEFIVLEGVVIVIAVFCLTAFHPGYCFPPMQKRNKVAPNGIMGDKDISDPEMAKQST
ncbi:MAG: hypothetical protein Q9186_005867 [Xanthomendoza sp. 1 TL-2023]